MRAARASVSSLGRAEPWSCSLVGDDGGAADVAGVMEEVRTDDMDAFLSEQSVESAWNAVCRDEWMLSDVLNGRYRTGCAAG